MTSVDVGPPVYGSIPTPIGAVPHAARQWPSGHTEILNAFGDWETYENPFRNAVFIPEEDDPK